MEYETDKTLLKELPQYLLAKSCFELKEFKRAAHFIAGCQAHITRFLYYYCLYLEGERLKLDFQMQRNLKMNKSCSIVNKEIPYIHDKLRALHLKKELDGFELYLYGIVLKEKKCLLEALNIFVEACNKTPFFYAIWVELSSLASTFPEYYSNLSLPSHWMVDVFSAQYELDCHREENSIDIYEKLAKIFEKSSFLHTKIGLCKYNARDLAGAQKELLGACEGTSGCMEGLDALSNIFHVQGKKEQLAKLAHEVTEINMRRPESCCIVGNYYSVYDDHQKAILYFKKALHLNSSCLSAWLFLGHEYLITNNVSKAIKAYHSVLEIDPNEFRAWYKLGHAYETLRQFPLALYYYKKTAFLRPKDERLSDAVKQLSRNIIECEETV
ncbi:cell division cycle protein 23 homolog [Zophobas morio]|uniref:cell division cycle protein 23 homolog n=1 Tax=Zophobas morio TaxID=2755281 RepID=UPI003083E33C